MAIAEMAARKLLHGGAIARGVADVGGISFGLWDLVIGFFANILAALAGVAHLLVLPLETLWQWLATTAADAAGAISSSADGPWKLATGLFPRILAALAGAAHELPQKLEELWRWLKAAAAVALPFVLVVAAVLLVVALVWFFAQCLQSCAVVAMKAPGTGGMVISRPAFVAAPALFFLILRAAGPGVATAVFCTATVARLALRLSPLFSVPS